MEPGNETVHVDGYSICYILVVPIPAWLDEQVGHKFMIMGAWCTTYNKFLIGWLASYPSNIYSNNNGLRAQA